VTSQPTFGDFLQAAGRQLDTAGASMTTAANGDVDEVTQSLLRVVTVLDRYARDATFPFDEVAAADTPLLNAWARASLDARQALANAAALLRTRGVPGPQPGTPPATTLARHLDSAAVSLAAGRDLLQTHFAPGPRGGRQSRSDWAPAIGSPPVTRALLSELASLAQQVAAQGAALAWSPLPRTRGTREDRRSLGAACQWLDVFGATIQAAQQDEPTPDGDRELLHAIPLNALPPRRVPDGSEPVAGLCDGATGSALRARHAAWDAAAQATWSPGTSVTSLRRVAAASTLTSYHCEVLLRTLAGRNPRGAENNAALLQAADAAGRARASWLSVASALKLVTTDTPGYVSPAAVEASDLALWTGRLAYASPEWTLVSGPAHPARAPHDLAPGAEDIPAVVAAIHHACETLTQLTWADREQIRTAARAGRILVPTRSLPDNYDIPHPYAHAPANRVDSLLGVYQAAGEANARTRDAVAGIAEATRAPSRRLTAARAVARARPDDRLGVERVRSSGLPVQGKVPDLPGPVEGTLRDLGFTAPDLLRRGAKIDHAGERLISAAVGEQQSPRRGHPGAQAHRRSTSTAVLINHALASGDPRAIAHLRGQTQRQPEPPEREP